MPGPVMKAPGHFPGIEKLGPLGQALIEQIFPPDSMPSPGMILGPRVPAAVPQGKSLIDSFRPWGKHLEKAYPDMFGPSSIPPVPDSVGHMQGAVQRLMSQIKKPY